MSSKRESARLSKGAYTEPKEDDFSGNSSDSEDESQDTNKTVLFAYYAGIASLLASLGQFWPEQCWQKYTCGHKFFLSLLYHVHTVCACWD